ncbi:sugar ABC transporter permease [Kitasatospora herbaricolor]|uniref:carbohydrate ABC transporter permease n=1 Tax=Kitasatospora herbaricolor TaxID=68217 RepID=UPI00174E8406|nr:carbohydrate ABC transporter permease [Kitasatospora herbaricolor]MDQ0311457.1 cellobiose transport system permease protein [Kitasatospora herbaricolor]GGV22211.1 sugar ABC transporter permease [Kitasatospora herbaricolor]
MTAVHPAAPVRTADQDAQAQAPRRRLRSVRKGAGRQHHAGPLTYAVLVLVALASLFPLYWTLVAASTDAHAVVSTPPPMIPGGNLFKNLSYVWHNAGGRGMGVALLNSTLVAGSVTIGTVSFSLLAGFAFAKLQFPGRGAMMGLVVATLAVPAQLSVVPLFILMKNLGQGNHLSALILPSLVTAFGVFFMRQFLVQALPSELLEAARMDGANSLRVVWHVVVPIARPAMAVLGMLTFVQSWNDFLWPIIAMNGSSNPTVQVALAGLGTGWSTDWSIIMAGALIGTLPLLLVFVLFGKHIVGGITQGAVKG